MFANICFEKNQNSKIHVTFMINITWNETGICSFGAVWAASRLGSQGSREKSNFNLCKFGMSSINMNHNIGFFNEKMLCYDSCLITRHGT